MRARGHGPDRTMGSSCPGCGAVDGLTSRAVRAVHETCAACGRSFTVIEPAVEPTPSELEEIEAAPRHAGGGKATGEGSSAPSGPPCRQCGAPLALRSWAEEGVEAQCPSCGANVRYRTMPPFRGPRGPSPGGYGERGGGGRFAPPQSRPCRECGGPLTFSTDEEGVVTGSCAQCGNRFTLPPRTGGGRPGGPRGRSGRFSGGFSRGFSRPRNRFGDDEERPERRRGPPRRTFRPRERAGREESTDYGERRRRKRREE